MTTSFWPNHIMTGCAEPQKLSGKIPLLLNNPAIVWVILEGRVEVYSVRILHGKPVGARRHHFTAYAGDVLPGMGENASGLALQMVGMPGTLVASMGVDKLFAGPEGFDSPAETAEAAQLIDRFLLGVCAGLTRDIVPKPSIRRELESGRIITFSESTLVRPRQGVWWLRPVSAQDANQHSPTGSMLYLGLEDIRVSGATPIGVLTSETWLEIDRGGRIDAAEVLDTEAMIFQHWLKEAFDQFAGLFFRCLDTELRLADVEIYDAMYTKNQAASRVRALGLQRLKEVLGEEQETSAGEYTNPLATACAMVVRATGVDIPEASFPGDERIEDIADFWGVKHRPVTLRDNWWRRDGGPLLGFQVDPATGDAMRMNRPVALLQPKPGCYVAHDPATATSFRLSSETAKKILPKAVSFYRPFPEKPIGIMELIRYTTFGSRHDFLYILFCGLALAFLAVIPPVVIKLIFSDAIPSADRSLLVQVVVMFAVVSLSVFAINLARLAALQRMAGKMDFHLEPAMWERLISLPAAYHRREGPGELADRIEGLNVVRTRLCDTFLTTMLTGIFASFNVIMLFVFGPKLALPALGMLLLGALAGAVFNLRQITSWQDYYALQGRITSMLVQFFSGIAKIRMSGSENQIFGLWAASFAAQQKKMMRTGQEQNILLIFNLVFPVAAMMVLFFFAAGLSGPMMETGSFLAFMAAYISLQNSLLAVTTSAVQLSAILPLYQRMKPIMETLPESRGLKSDPGRLQGRIELTQVHFRYNPEGPAILDGVNLEINPGEFVAVVGPSGSGKSTILRLLLGFETPISGSVRYDGKDLADLNMQKLRRQNLGVVMQESGLLPGDILYNITGMRNISLEDAWEAARMAGVDDDIRRMPLGMHTPIGEGGTTFSTGQKQRLSIARALAGKPRILLLDEATSALDNRTQEIVSTALDRLRVTRVVVAHRLSTVRNADKIVVLDKGHIVESGTYSDLMDRGGRFHDLVMRQVLPG